MATLANFVSVEEYLHNPEWERCEYVDGAVEERGMPTYDHSAWIDAICYWFRQHAEEWNIRVRPAYTNRASETRYRIPDVSIIDFDLPKESVAVRRRRFFRTANSSTENQCYREADCSGIHETTVLCN